MTAPAQPGFRAPPAPLVSEPTAPALARNFRLPNGLRVLHVPRPDSAIVGLALSFDVGSRHERPDQRGLSHLLEHLAFAGTARWTEAELRDQISLRGGLWNGFTSQQHTAYLALLPAGEIAAGLEYLRQVGFEPALGPDRLAREKRVIDAEAGQWPWRWHLAARRWLVRCRLVSAVGAYADELLHPAPAQWDPPIGYPWTRRGLTLADVRAHHRRFCTTTNAWLVVLGGRSTRAVCDLAQAAYGDVPARPAEPPPPPAPAPRGLGRRHRLPLVTMDTELALLVACPFAGKQDPDWPAIGLARHLIREVLQQRLRTELGLVYSVDVLAPNCLDHGHLRIVARVAARAGAQAERELLAGLDRLRAGDVDPAVWERVCRQARGGWLLARDDHSEFLEWLTEHTAALERHPAGPWIMRPAAPDLAEARRVLARLLAPENRLVVVHAPSRLVSHSLAVAGAFALLGGGLLMAFLFALTAAFVKAGLPAGLP